LLAAVGGPDRFPKLIFCQVEQRRSILLRKPMSDELRNTRRARLAGVRVTIEGATGERHQADVADLSKEGLFIVSAAPLAIGKRLSLEIYVVGEPAAWPALGRVVWTREISEGDDRPAGMGVKIIDIDDTAAAAVDRLLETRERTEPGLGDKEKPEALREKTILGVGVESEPPMPPAPIIVPSPGRESTLLGVGTSGAIAREPSLPIDLVAKKPSSAPPAAAAPASEPEVVRSPSPPARKGSGGLWFLLLALLAGCAIAAYAMRDRLLSQWQRAPATEISPAAPKPSEVPAVAPAPSPTPAPTPTPAATAVVTPDAAATPDAGRGAAPSAMASSSPSSSPSSGGSTKHPAIVQPSATPPHKPKASEDINPY
jgi:Tfp pilus assembly protein PilZ